MSRYDSNDFDESFALSVISEPLPTLQQQNTDEKKQRPLTPREATTSERTAHGLGVMPPHPFTVQETHSTPTPPMSPTQQNHSSSSNNTKLVPQPSLSTSPPPTNRSSDTDEDEQSPQFEYQTRSNDPTRQFICAILNAAQQTENLELKSKYAHPEPFYFSRHLVTGNPRITPNGYNLRPTQVLGFTQNSHYKFRLQDQILRAESIYRVAQQLVLNSQHNVFSKFLELETLYQQTIIEIETKHAITYLETHRCNTESFEEKLTAFRKVVQNFVAHSAALLCDTVNPKLGKLYVAELKYGEMGYLSTLARPHNLHLFEVAGTNFYSAKFEIARLTAAQCQATQQHDKFSHLPSPQSTAQKNRAISLGSPWRYGQGLVNYAYTTFGINDNSARDIIPLIHIIRHGSYPAIGISNTYLRQAAAFRNVRQNIEIIAKQQFATTGKTYLYVKLSSFSLMSFDLLEGFRGTENENRQIYESWLALSAYHGRELILNLDGEKVTTKVDILFMTCGCDMKRNIHDRDLPISLSSARDYQTELNIRGFYQLGKQVCHFLESCSGDKENDFTDLRLLFNRIFNHPDLYTIDEKIQTILDPPLNPKNLARKYRELEQLSTQIEAAIYSQSQERIKEYSEKYDQLLADIEAIDATIQKDYNKIAKVLKTQWTKNRPNGEQLQKFSLDNKTLDNNPGTILLRDCLSLLNDCCELFFDIEKETIAKPKMHCTKYLFQFPAKFLILAYKIGRIPDVFCKSGEDRTGELENTFIYLLTYRTLKHKFPNDNIQEDNDSIRRIASYVTQFSMATEITGQNNPGARGLQIGDDQGPIAAALQLGEFAKPIAQLAKEVFKEIDSKTIEEEQAYLQAKRQEEDRIVSPFCPSNFGSNITEPLLKKHVGINPVLVPNISHFINSCFLLIEHLNTLDFEHQFKIYLGLISNAHSKQYEDWFRSELTRELSRGWLTTTNSSNPLVVIANRCRDSEQKINYYLDYLKSKKKFLISTIVGKQTELLENLRKQFKSGKLQSIIAIYTLIEQWLRKPGCLNTETWQTKAKPYLSQLNYLSNNQRAMQAFLTTHFTTLETTFQLVITAVKHVIKHELNPVADLIEKLTQEDNSLLANKHDKNHCSDATTNRRALLTQLYATYDILIGRLKVLSADIKALVTRIILLYNPMRCAYGDLALHIDTRPTFCDFNETDDGTTVTLQKQHQIAKQALRRYKALKKSRPPLENNPVIAAHLKPEHIFRRDAGLMLTCMIPTAGDSESITSTHLAQWLIVSVQQAKAAATQAASGKHGLFSAGAMTYRELKQHFDRTAYTAIIRNSRVALEKLQQDLITIYDDNLYKCRDSGLVNCFLQQVDTYLKILNEKPNENASTIGLFKIIKNDDNPIFAYSARINQYIPGGKELTDRLNPDPYQRTRRHPDESLVGEFREYFTKVNDKENFTDNNSPDIFFYYEAFKYHIMNVVNCINNIYNNNISGRDFLFYKKLISIHVEFFINCKKFWNLKPYNDTFLEKLSTLYEQAYNLEEKLISNMLPSFYKNITEYTVKFSKDKRYKNFYEHLKFILNICNTLSDVHTLGPDLLNCNKAFLKKSVGDSEKKYSCKLPIDIETLQKLISHPGMSILTEALVYSIHIFIQPYLLIGFLLHYHQQLDSNKQFRQTIIGNHYNDEIVKNCQIIIRNCLGLILDSEEMQLVSRCPEIRQPYCEGYQLYQRMESARALLEQHKMLHSTAPRAHA